MYQYEELANELFDIQSWSGEECMAFCTEHHNVNTPALSINLDKGVVHCFSCGYSASFVKGEGAVVDTYTALLRRIEGNLKDMTDQDDDTRLVVDEKLLLRFNNYTTYWQDRGLTQKTIEDFELGYDPLDNAVTIPNRDIDGALLGVSKRFLDDDHPGGKYRHPKGYKKSRAMFAYNRFLNSDSTVLVLVEGQIDAIKVWQAGYTAVAIMGSSPSEYQTDMIRRSECRVVIDARDNYLRDDAAYAKRSALKGFKDDEYNPKLDLRKFVELRRVNWTLNEPKDLGEMTTRSIATMLGRSKIV